MLFSIMSMVFRETPDVQRQLGLGETMCGAHLFQAGAKQIEL